MSEENRPNFHAARFVTDMMTSYKSSLRGDAAKMGFLFDDRLRDMFVEFTEEVNEYVDVQVSSGQPCDKRYPDAEQS